MMKLILLSLSLLVFNIQFQTILSCSSSKCKMGYACCTGKTYCDKGDGGECYRSCSQIPPSMQEYGSHPPGKSHTLPFKMFGPFWSVWCKIALAEAGMSLP